VPLVIGILPLVAVTQQLARVGEELLEQCRRDVRQLDEVCSFRAFSESDYLDLDWAPHWLETAAVIAEVAEDSLAGLKASTTGGDEINPEYREWPTVWEHPLTSLSALRVREVNQALQSLTLSDFLSDEIPERAVLTHPPHARPSVQPAGNQQ
jgi:hypothetical protein